MSLALLEPITFEWLEIQVYISNFILLYKAIVLSAQMNTFDQEYSP